MGQAARAGGGRAYRIGAAVLRALRVGLISDTHALIRDEALRALARCAHIIHAGDIVRPEILGRLREIAPVTAVRGNNDRGEWADSLPDWDVVEFGLVSVYVRHDRAQLDFDPPAAGFRVIVTGHSHKPTVETREGVLYVNPGSAGPRRFRLPIAVAELTIDGERVEARIIDLTAQTAKSFGHGSTRKHTDKVS